MSLPPRARELEERIRQQIPLALAMDVRIRDWQGASIVLAAPLAPNINDKGTGFAGSLSTLATLAGWSLATLLGEQALDAAAPELQPARCAAAVARSELEFLQPVRGELLATARLADDSLLPRLGNRLAGGRRLRVPVTAVLGEENDPAVRFRGEYALWRAGARDF